MKNRNLRACASCHNTGKDGAQFHLVVNGEVDNRDVHKHCGKKLARGHPDPNAKVEVVHFAALRRRREEAATSAFWAEKFAEARARAKA